MRHSDDRRTVTRPNHRTHGFIIGAVATAALSTFVGAAEVTLDNGVGGDGHIQITTGIAGAWQDNLFGTPEWNDFFDPGLGSNGVNPSRGATSNGFRPNDRTSDAHPDYPSGKSHRLGSRSPRIRPIRCRSNYFLSVVSPTNCRGCQGRPSPFGGITGRRGGRAKAVWRSGVAAGHHGTNWSSLGRPGTGAAGPYHRQP